MGFPVVSADLDVQGSQAQGVAAGLCCCRFYGQCFRLCCRPVQCKILPGPFT
jgi:hypothetical protein